MATLGIKCRQGDEETVTRFLLDGLLEEKKKLEYAISISEENIMLKEKKHGMSSAVFLERFGRREIDENDDTFQWWAELKLSKSLSAKLEKLNGIEICPQ